MSMYAADFETTTVVEDCRVWAWAVCNIENPSEVHYGKDIATFMYYMFEHGGTYYFHNLAFDGEFILSWLFQNGFEFSVKRETKTFHTMISSTGKFYQLTITFEKKGKQKARQVTIRDSLKKLPFSVSRIAKAFELPEQKGEIDYEAPRPVGHEMTEEEKKYITDDVVIVARALQEQFAHGLEKLTVGADALNMFKELTGNKWNSLFPEINLYIDSQIRRAYRGGYTYLKTEHQGNIIGDGCVLDVNSLYPSVMYSKPLPVGVPLYFKGKYQPNPMYPLYIQHFTCMVKLKKGKLPTLQIKNNPFFIGTQYIEETEEPVELFMSNVDLDLLHEHYDVDILYNVGGYMFMEQTGIFQDYIDFWTEIKVSSTGGKRELAKLMLNSLYGKFATNPDITPKIPTFGEDGVVHYVVGEPDFRKPVYTPVGVFVTAWARDTTIRAAQANFDRFIYADTDSLHLLGTEMPNLNIHPTELGAWKHEGNFTKAKFLRAKTYMEEIDGESHVKCAGLPANLRHEITFDNFQSGLQIFGKLRPVHCKGGIVLEPTTFTVL